MEELTAPTTFPFLDLNRALSVDVTLFLLVLKNIHAQVEEIASTAKFGDLIEFSYPIGYSHWAVYDKDGYVIHFAVAGKKVFHNHTRNNR